MYYRKLLNVTATLPTPAGVSLREHLSFARMLSLNFSARTCFSHNNNKQCIVPAHTSCFDSSPRCDYPNRHVSASVPMSTRTGLLLRPRRPIIKTFSDWQTSVAYCSKINQQSRLYACSTRRHFSSQSKANEETKLNVDYSHSTVEDVEDIYKKIIFKNGDIVVINKPNGLSVYGSSVKSDRSGNVVGVLDTLKDRLNCPELEIGLSLKSFYSGVMILCKHKKSKEKLESILAGVQAQKIQFKTYLAITVGVPQCEHGVDLSANIRRDYLHNRELTDVYTILAMSIVVDKRSNTEAKDGKMITTYFSVQPLVVNSSLGAALVQVTINKDKWEAVEVLMSHNLSPVLGDHIYSSRAQLIKGIPFVASAHASVPGPQKLPSTIVEALQPRVDCGKNLPLFVHCHKVVLNRFPKKSSRPMILTAPPQEEFLTTLQCLGLYQEGMFS